MRMRGAYLSGPSGLITIRHHTYDVQYSGPRLPRGMSGGLARPRDLRPGLCRECSLACGRPRGLDDYHRVEAVECPACSRVFLTHCDVAFGDWAVDGMASIPFDESGEFILRPRTSAKPPVSPDVPEPYPQSTDAMTG